MNTNLYVVAVVFNPFDFKSRYRLYWDFKRHMEHSGVKLFTVEVAFGDMPFRVTTPHDAMSLQLRTRHILWMKERAINRGVEKLLLHVPDCRYLGWIDADVTFAHPTWAEQAVHKLSHTKVIQPFSTAINLNSKDDYMWHCPSTIRAFIEGRGFHQEPPVPIYSVYKGHPGLAWCIRREVWEELGGLYEHCAAGSADTVMANCFKGDYSAFLPVALTPGMKRSMEEYQERVNRHVRGSIGYTDGCLLHHWHGHSEERGYEKRWSILAFHQFDPNTDICDDEENGLLRWSGNKPRLEDDIRFSLSRRNEDAV